MKNSSAQAINSMNTPPLIRLVRVGFCIAVAIGIVAGLYVSGSPATQRRYSLDERRVSDLSQISYSIDSYSQSHTGSAPESLSELQLLSQYPLSSIVDPETGAQYEYHRTSSTTYQLCANFSLASNPDHNDLVTPAMDIDGKVITRWTHGAGRSCFDLIVRLQPTPPPIMASPLQNAPTSNNHPANPTTSTATSTR